MPVAARCPSCAAPLSETSVLALAPICTHCGVVITSIGGTLGLTSAYGVADPTITRRRVEADLAVFHEYRLKYEGMQEACIQQLEWSVERYADLPKAPEFLELQKALPVWLGLIWAPVSFVGGLVAGTVLKWIHGAFDLFRGIYVEIFEHRGGRYRGEWPSDSFILLLAWGALIACVLAIPISHFRVSAVNGNRPKENARRQKAYEEATVAALKAAERSKAAEDHRLRLQIRELEGLAKTVAAKEAEVRRILATL